MLGNFKGWLSGVALSAATKLAPIAPPKVKPGSYGMPGYLKTATPTTAPLPVNDRRLMNTDITTLRNQGSTAQVMRQMVAATPDLSAAVFSYIRAAITSSYTAVAKNPDGTFNRDATSLLQQLIVRFDVLNDYTEGFSGISSMRSNSESFAKEILTYGACAAELVLGKDRLPRRIQPLSVTAIQFIQDKGDPKILAPVQRIAGQTIDLDFPTFFYVALDQDLLEPYASSPLESALQPVMFSQEFFNDIRRVIKRAVHPRINVVIDEEKFRKSVPQEAHHDQVKMTAFQDKIIEDVQTQINGLNPEDALVNFDLINVNYLNNGNISLSTEYEVLGKMTDAKMATGAKTLPAILGHGAGSSNIASTETLLFMKNAEGAVKAKLDELYSRILTLAVRLFGFDVYVEFRYAPIDLRPESELESFKQTKQSRLLELLSIGMITDEEASLALTGNLPPQAMQPLSGTFFKSASAVAGSSGGAAAHPSNDGSTLNQNLNPDVPSQGRGQNKKANPVKAGVVEIFG